MKLRIKYSKLGNLRFIGHLDVMRYFQKTIRRAGLQVSYSKGYSPHQIISFAAPLAMCITSDGEYFDGEFEEISTSGEMIDALNQYGVEELKVSECVLLPDEAKNSMSVVVASDYMITFKALTEEESSGRMLEKENVTNIGNIETDDTASENAKHILECVADFHSQSEIVILKKTKKSEKEENIKPGILQIAVKDNGIYMLLSTGSTYNLKPELVMEALCQYAGISYNFFDFHIHRMETYMEDENGDLMPLYKAGRNF